MKCLCVKAVHILPLEWEEKDTIWGSFYPKKYIPSPSFSSLSLPFQFSSPYSYPYPHHFPNPPFPFSFPFPCLLFHLFLSFSSLPPSFNLPTSHPFHSHSLHFSFSLPFLSSIFLFNSLPLPFFFYFPFISLLPSPSFPLPSSSFPPPIPLLSPSLLLPISPSLSFPSPFPSFSLPLPFVGNLTQLFCWVQFSLNTYFILVPLVLPWLYRENLNFPALLCFERIETNPFVLVSFKTFNSCFNYIESKLVSQNTLIMAF